MSPAPVAEQEPELFFLEAGGQLFAGDPLDVVRVDRPSPMLPDAVLREPRRADRVLVIRGEVGEVQVPVDRVLGVRRVPRDRIRAAPRALEEWMSSSPVRVLGVLLEEAAPVLVVDLHALARASQ